MQTGANRRHGVAAASWQPAGFEGAETREVRYLPVMSNLLGQGDDALLELSVNCPRRGRTGLEDCMDCSHGGRLRHHGRRGPLVLVCTLERRWREGRS